MILTVANISRQLGATEFQAAVAAIGRQVMEDFQPEWSIAAYLRSTAFKLGHRKAPIQGHHDAIIYVGDASEDPTTGVDGALGYHSDNHAGVPYGFVYLDICEQLEESWTSTLSHEVLELLADPTAVFTVSAPAPHQKHSVYYDLEVCDPTQGDSYEIDSVTVSNFVGRRYFGLPGGTGRTNYLNLHLEPFGVRPNGYLQYEDRRGTHQVNGKSVTERQLAAKKRLGDARRNERRAQRALMASEKGAGQIT
jgi:hypothetical protein